MTDNNYGFEPDTTKGHLYNAAENVEELYVYPLMQEFNISYEHACLLHDKLHTDIWINCPRCKKEHYLHALNYKTLHYRRLCDDCWDNRHTYKKKYKYDKQKSQPCECGGSFNFYQRDPHFSTQRHLKYLMNK